MTKKLKEITTKAVLPAEVVDTLATPDEEINFSDGQDIPSDAFNIDGQGIPFLDPSFSRCVTRPYRINISSDPVVEIVGKVLTGRDVDHEEAKKLGLVTWPTFGDGNILTSRRDFSGQSYHSSWITLKPSDVKFKHYDVAGVDIYITNGSKFIVTESMDAESAWSEHLNTQPKPKLVIVASELTSKGLTVSGNVSLKNASVTGSGLLTLIDSSIEYSTVNGKYNYSTIDDTHLYGVYIQADQSLTLTDTNLTDTSVTGMKSISMDRVSGGHDFKLSMFPSANALQFSFRASNQYLHTYVASAYGRIGKDYQPVCDAPFHHDTEWTATIERRIDYGMFAGAKPIPFVRIGQYDILVGNQIFSVKEFFPELLTKQEEPKTVDSEYRPGGWPSYPAPAPSPFVPFGVYVSRGSLLWKKVAGIAFENEKAVIGKMGETIIESLLDQIRSRIKLYTEISTFN